MRGRYMFIRTSIRSIVNQYIILPFMYDPDISKIYFTLLHKLKILNSDKKIAKNLNIFSNHSILLTFQFDTILTYIRIKKYINNQIVICINTIDMRGLNCEYFKRDVFGGDNISKEDIICINESHDKFIH